MKGEKEVWQLYDDLINEIPENLTVRECMLGVSWTLVKSEKGLGVAKTIKGGKKGTGLRNVVGMSLKELAKYAKSWNMLEASMGQAAINAAFNTQSEILNLSGQTIEQFDDPEKNNVFKLLEPEFSGKKVAIIGHFPGIEQLHNICELSILEREPQADDYPDSACEYILPEQDFVFITGTAFTNKTMPRLLELSNRAKITLVGPSVPISKVLFKYGVELIGGFVVTDEYDIWKAVQEGIKMNIFKRGGKMICLHQ